MHIFIGSQNNSFTTSAEKALHLLGNIVDTRILVFTHIDADIDKYDVVILHGTDPKQILNMTINARTFTQCPIMIVSQEKASRHIPEILDGGADDCMIMPVNFTELHARLESLVRRDHKTRFVSAKILIGDLEIDLQKHTVKSGENSIILTKTEYKFLCQLALKKDHIVSRAILSKHLPHENAAKVSHAVTMHIFNLRKKLFGHVNIDTISSQGFMIKG